LAAQGASTVEGAGIESCTLRLSAGCGHCCSCCTAQRCLSDGGGAAAHGRSARPLVSCLGGCLAKHTPEAQRLIGASCHHTADGTGRSAASVLLKRKKQITKPTGPSTTHKQQPTRKLLLNRRLTTSQGGLTPAASYLEPSGEGTMCSTRPVWPVNSAACCSERQNTGSV
jgi:hypothetical protein